VRPASDQSAAARGSHSARLGQYDRIAIITSMAMTKGAEPSQSATSPRKIRFTSDDCSNSAERPLRIVRPDSKM
jgi:hypothetical protein